MRKTLRRILPLMLFIATTGNVFAQNTVAELITQIEEAKRNNVTEFSFGRTMLSEIPPEIGQLINLRELSIYGLALNELPPEIGQLINLRELGLYDLTLDELPPEIGQLINLEILRIGSNTLTELPPDIGRLTNLRELYLERNRLTRLPGEIGNLVNLHTLDVVGNGLIELPAEIGNLSQLEFVDLSYNYLDSLPIEFANLDNLEELRLDNNQFTEIPLAVTGLSSLEVLDFRQRETIVVIPPEIGNMRQLRELTIYGVMGTIPPEIGNLQNLEVLTLAGADIPDDDIVISLVLPPEIGNLNQLEVLQLPYMGLQALPPEMGRLNNLRVLSLSGNNLDNLPASFINLENLCSIRLSRNNFERLPSVLAQLPRLGTDCRPPLSWYRNSLIIDGNPLEDIPPEMSLTSIQDLFLYQDAPILWLISRLRIGLAMLFGLVAFLLFVALMKQGRWRNTVLFHSRWSLLPPFLIYTGLLFTGIYYRFAFFGFWSMLCGAPLLMLIYLIWRFIVYRKHILSTIIAILWLIASQFIYFIFIALPCEIGRAHV